MGSITIRMDKIRQINFTSSLMILIGVDNLKCSSAKQILPEIRLMYNFKINLSN